MLNLALRIVTKIVYHVMENTKLSAESLAIKNTKVFLEKTSEKMPQMF